MSDCDKCGDPYHHHVYLDGEQALNLIEKGCTVTICNDDNPGRRLARVTPGAK